MICVSPVDFNVEESVSSLVYASRMKLITNAAEKQQESAEVQRLKRVIALLKSGQAVPDAELADLERGGRGEAEGGAGGRTPGRGG